MIMGGHAVRYYGLSRNTVDFDPHIAPDSWDELPARLARNCAFRRESPGTDSAEIAVTALYAAPRTHNDERTRREAARSLGRFGRTAAIAVPELTRSSRTADPSAARWDNWFWIAADSILRIDPGSPADEEAVAALAKTFLLRDPTSRDIAVKTLISLGPAAAPGRPCLDRRNEKKRRLPPTTPGANGFWMSWPASHPEPPQLKLRFRRDEALICAGGTSRTGDARSQSLVRRRKWPPPGSGPGSGRCETRRISVLKKYGRL